MKPISHYINKDVPGWDEMPAAYNMAREGMEDYSCSFLSGQEALHLMASVKDMGAIQAIHVSIGQIDSIGKAHGFTPEDLYEHSLSMAAELLDKFFPGRGFARAPEDPRRPNMHHYFSILEPGE